jgi:hypothetical protein
MLGTFMKPTNSRRRGVLLALDEYAKTVKRAALIIKESPPEVLAIVARAFMKDQAALMAAQTHDAGLSAHVRSAINGIQGHITVQNVHELLRVAGFRFKGGRRPKAQVSDVLRRMARTGELELMTPASGRRPAIYRKP